MDNGINCSDFVDYFVGLQIPYSMELVWLWVKLIENPKKGSRRMLNILMKWIPNAEYEQIHTRNIEIAFTDLYIRITPRIKQHYVIQSPDTANVTVQKSR